MVVIVVVNLLLLTTTTTTTTTTATTTAARATTTATATTTHDDDEINGGDKQGSAVGGARCEEHKSKQNGHGAKRGGAIGQPTAVKTNVYEQARLEATERAPSQNDGRMEKFETYAIFKF